MGPARGMGHAWQRGRRALRRSTTCLMLIDVLHTWGDRSVCWGGLGDLYWSTCAPYLDLHRPQSVAPPPRGSMRDLGLFKHLHMLVDTWLWLVRSGGDEVSVIWAQFCLYYTIQCTHRYTTHYCHSESPGAPTLSFAELSSGVSRQQSGLRRRSPQGPRIPPTGAALPGSQPSLR